jgi:hypothetical protein
MAGYAATPEKAFEKVYGYYEKMYKMEEWICLILI